VCLRGSTLVKPTARDLNKSAILCSTSVPPPPLARPSREEERASSRSIRRPAHRPARGRSPSGRSKRDRAIRFDFKRDDELRSVAFHLSVRLEMTITGQRGLLGARSIASKSPRPPVSEIREASPALFLLLSPSPGDFHRFACMKSCTMGYL